MESGADDRDWPAVAIERRVGDELVIQGPMQGLADFKVVISLHNLFQIVIQPSVAGENPCSSGSQERAMNPGNAIDDACDPDRVTRTLPRTAIHAEAKRGCVVNVAEHPGFIFS